MTGAGRGGGGITLVWYVMKIRLSARCSVEFQDVSEMLQISSNIYRVDCLFFIIDVREHFIESDINIEIDECYEKSTRQNVDENHNELYFFS